MAERQQQQELHEETLRSRETASLIGSDKVEDTEVRNPAGELLGTVERVMIDKLTGKVAYAVIAFGGFLGIGHKHHALPWSMLRYDTDQDAYVVNLTKEQVQGAPAWRGEEEFDWRDRDWGQRLHDYYRVPPYWL